MKAEDLPNQIDREHALRAEKTFSLAELDALRFAQEPLPLGRVRIGARARRGTLMKWDEACADDWLRVIGTRV